MPGDAGVERVGRERRVALHQPEVGARHDQVQEGRLGADRAVAALHRHRRRRPDLEAHGAAVTSASMRDLVHAGPLCPGVATLRAK